MEFNSIIFPKKSSYTPDSFQNLILVPKEQQQYYKDTSGQLYYYPTENQIPCIYLPCAKSSLLLMYFHGNAEDLRDCQEFLTSFRDTIKINVLAFEYPGYGIYQQGEPNAETIMEDSEIVYNFMVNQCGFKESNIILFGRSIGTGPATALAAKKNCKQLVLMSGFATLRSIVKELFGTILSYFVAERFKNVELIEKVKCPVLVIHGQKDNLISYKQSIELLKHCKSPCSYLFPEQMTHNNFNLYDDIIYPLKNVLENKFGNANNRQIYSH